MYIHLFLETFGSCKFCGNKHKKKKKWKQLKMKREMKRKWREKIPCYFLFKYTGLTDRHSFCTNYICYYIKHTAMCSNNLISCSFLSIVFNVHVYLLKYTIPGNISSFRNC